MNAFYGLNGILGINPSSKNTIGLLINSIVTSITAPIITARAILLSLIAFKFIILDIFVDKKIEKNNAKIEINDARTSCNSTSAIPIKIFTKPAFSPNIVFLRVDKAGPDACNKEIPIQTTYIKNGIEKHISLYILI